MSSKIAALLVMPRARRCSLLEQLDSARIEVFPVCNVQEATEVLAQCTIHVVLTDTVLPDGDWRGVLECVGKGRSKPEVVVCATAPSRTLRAEIFQRGVYDLVTEPYIREEILRTVEAAAARSYMQSLAAPALAFRTAG